MNINLITEYPIWFIFFCFLLGALYAFVLYRKDKLLADVSKWTKRILAAFRFLAVSVLAFLLLGPLLKTIFREVEKPVIIIAQDNSESILIGKDSVFYKTEYKEKLEELINNLQNKFDVKSYSFGDEITNAIDLSFHEKQTGISDLLEEIYNRYSNRNVGAIVIASDGIYNKGSNPVYASSKIKFPIYTIALGDTSVKKDIILTKVAHNRLAYLGNSFPLEIIAEARKCKGNNMQLTIYKGKELLFSKKMDINSDNFTQTIPVLLEAKEAGIQRYKVRLSRVEEEVSFANNEQDIFIDVLDGRQKILILANAPHPDITALKQSMELNDNYEVTVALANDFNQSLKDYNLVVLHQLPSLTNPIVKIIEDLVKNNTSRLFILGNHSSLNYFNNLQTGLTITGNAGKQNESQAFLTDNFTLFTLNENTLNSVKKFPPLITPFGNYKVSGASHALLNQRIGIVDTKEPLVLFNAAEQSKTGVIAGEGIWRWRMADYSENQNHDVFDELISKMVQYLSVKVDKSHFRVLTKNNYYENEAVEFDAELYNDSYELINEPEVSMTIINSDNKKFPYVFNKTTNAYHLNAGILPVGDYRYEARVKAGDKILTEKGEFSVSPLQVESINTVADHQLLYNLAQQHMGEMVYKNELNQLEEMLINREDIKPVSYTQQKLNEMINLKWVFFLILVLLSFEWFIRKRSGAY